MMKKISLFVSVLFFVLSTITVDKANAGLMTLNVTGDVDFIDYFVENPFEGVGGDISLTLSFYPEQFSLTDTYPADNEGVYTGLTPATHTLAIDQIPVDPYPNPADSMDSHIINDDIATGLDIIIFTYLFNDGSDFYYDTEIHLYADSGTFDDYLVYPDQATLESFTLLYGDIFIYGVGATGDGELHANIMSADFAPVPEPATLFLLGSGLFGMVGLKKRKKSV